MSSHPSAFAYYSRSLSFLGALLVLCVPISNYHLPPKSFPISLLLGVATPFLPVFFFHVRKKIL